MCKKMIAVTLKNDICHEKNIRSESGRASRAVSVEEAGKLIGGNSGLGQALNKKKAASSN